MTIIYLNIYRGKEIFMQLKQSTKDALDAALTQAAEEYCAFDAVRKKEEELFAQEEQLYKKHTDDVRKSSDALLETFKSTMADNAVYKGSYHNETEKKDDARKALTFAKACAVLKKAVGIYGAQYGAASAQRMICEQQRGKPTDDKLKNKATEIAQRETNKGVSIRRALYLIPIAVAILFIFIPLLLRPVTSPAFDNFFYAGKTPNVVYFSLFIGIAGLIATGIFNAFRRKAQKKAIEQYLTKDSGVWKKIGEKNAKLTEFYEEKSAEAKKHSDEYFNIMTLVTQKMVNEIYLKPFPQEFTDLEDLAAGEQLLATGRAESLKDVYDILERRHNENAKAQAEAQHRARMESINMEQLRSQQKAEEYARKQAAYAREQAEYARAQADAAKEQAQALGKMAEESERQTEYARRQAESASTMQSDIDFMKRNN